MTRDWRPGATPETLRLRADLLRRARLYFSEREVLEVETPALARASATDGALESLVCTEPSGDRPLYLQTSPEFFMKRLLAAGSGSIYQFCRVFRAGERGRRHNPEFSLLEWYRTGIDYLQLMDEVADLVGELLPGGLLRDPPLRISWAEAFQRYAGVDGLTADQRSLRLRAQELGVEPSAELAVSGREVWLDLLMSHAVEPALPRERLVFLYRYPAAQAALAQIDSDDPRICRRFELYLNGVELANGFQELADAAEQRERFEADQRKRRRRGLADVPSDPLVLAALACGLPACSGVALGFDRLVMLAGGLGSVDQAMAFSWDRV